MVRLTASGAFNIDTFDLSTLFDNSVVALNSGSFPVGLRNFEFRLSATDNVGPDRAQMLAYMDDVTLTGGTTGTINGGTLLNLQLNTGFGTTGWQPTLRLSAMEASAADFAAAIDTDTTVDDRAFLAGILAGNDTISLSNLADKMDSGAGNDSMLGNLGNDTLGGGAGNDTIDGGLGNDLVVGGSDNDTVIGGRGNDTVGGGAGNDVVRGGSAADLVSGGAGVDIFDYKRGDGLDIITDYNDLEDFIRIDVVDTANPGWVKAQVGADVVITLTGVAGFAITIQSETAANIQANDFIFV